MNHVDISAPQVARWQEWVESGHSRGRISRGPDGVVEGPGAGITVADLNAFTVPRFVVGIAALARSNSDDMRPWEITGTRILALCFCNTGIGPKLPDMNVL